MLATVDVMFPSVLCILGGNQAWKGVFWTWMD